MQISKHTTTLGLADHLLQHADDYTIAQWLAQRWLQARVPGSSPGGDSQFDLQPFPVCVFPSNQ